MIRCSALDAQTTVSWTNLDALKLREAHTASWPPWGPIVVGHTTEGEPVTWEDLLWGAQEVIEWLRLKLTGGLCSKVLMGQLAASHCRVPQVFGGPALLIDVHAVFDQIGELERMQEAEAVRTRQQSRVVVTQSPKPWSSGPLKGLWHKHWFQASFVLKNCLRELQDDERSDQLLYGSLNAMFGRSGWQGKILDHELAGRMARIALDGAFQQRAGIAGRRRVKSRLTGEWIIYARLKGRNIYLTLGSHDEPKDHILKRCCMCLDEFPELRELEIFKSA